MKQKLNFFVMLIQSSWMPPTVSSVSKNDYRYYQFISLLKTMPLLGITCYILIFLGIFLSWQVIPQYILIMWGILLFSSTTVCLAFWRRYCFSNKIVEFNPIHISIIVFCTSISALLYAYLSFKLFISIDFHQKIALTGVTVAIASIGCWMFSSVPLAGLLWSLFIPGILSFWLFQLPHDYYLTAGLSVFYCIFLFGSVLVTSYKFNMYLASEKENEERRKLIKLLLDDFEESANDWLWEIDEKGFLRHVSIQLVNATGIPLNKIRKIFFLDIINGLSTQKPDFIEAYETLKKHLRKDESFKEVTLPVIIKGELKWWSMTAKPLFDQNNVLTGWRGVTLDITELHLKKIELVRVANEDTLTGLANRYQFNSALNQVLINEGGNQSCCLMMLDLDHFKMINDSLGHKVGDEILRCLAVRIAAIIPEGTLFARVGGDEFSLILTQNPGRVSAEALAKKIQAEASEPMELHGHKIAVKMSVGVCFAPDNGTNANDLLPAADFALFDAKTRGSNNIGFFTEELREKALYKQMLLTDLSAAIANNQLFLVYQPQFHLQSMKLVGFEALVRWQHPTLGFIAPDVFIPLAESSQLIVALGEWVLQQACHDALDWPHNISVAVNVSGVQLQQAGFAQQLSEALMMSGLAYNKLELELTETSVTATDHRIFETLDNFRKRGGSVAIDDFGTGYSSFSYLHAFPLDKLKIDRSFVQLLDSVHSLDKGKAIIKSIVRLGKILDLKVLAEGVECDIHKDTLRKMKCDFSQGYLFSKPMPIKKVKKFIELHS